MKDLVSAILYKYGGYYYKMKNYFLAIFIVSYISANITLNARVFEDQFGRIINAELVSHTGNESENVTIKKSGKKMVVKVSLFSEKDQKFIREWMTKIPPTLDYNFRVEVAKKEIENKPGTNPFKKSDDKEVAYLMRLTNLTRQPVSGLRVEYRAYMKNYGSGGSNDTSSIREEAEKSGRDLGGVTDKQIEDFIRDRFGGGSRGRRGRDYGNSTKPKIIHVEESKSIEETLKFNQAVTIESKAMKLDSFKSRWSNDRYKDELIGVIVRVFEQGGEMVYEYRDQSTKEYIWAESNSPVRGFTDDEPDLGFDDSSRQPRGFTGE